MGISSSRSSFSSTFPQESINNDTSKSSIRRARGKVENKLRDLGGYLPLYNAAANGEWREARNFFDQDPDALTAKITIASETALHIAVGTTHAVDFVEKLVREMTPENLALTDQQGDTALSVAAMVGNITAARILVNKNPDLPNIPGKNGFPIHKAVRFGRKYMADYLLRVTKPDLESNPFVGEAGGRLLIDVIEANFYDIALELVNRYPETATMEVIGVGSPLTALTRKSIAFASSRVPNLWGSLLIFDFSPWKREEIISMQKDARELVRAICKEILELDDAKVFSLLQQPLHNAAILGIPEIIQEIVDAYPPAIWFTDKDNYSIFQLAVLNRRVEVFNLINRMDESKYLIASNTDSKDNNMLHLVGLLPSSDRLNLVSGPAFQFQVEMHWFQEVARFVQPAQRLAKNKEGKTPEMVFMDAHEQLMKEGVLWVKQTITLSTVFASLVATTAFAGVMHVPEGNTYGTTDLHYNRAFKIYVLTDTTSLILSVISIMTFLSIIISRRSEVYFLTVVPLRLYFGLSILFVSINTILIAFGVALYLLLKPKNLNTHVFEYGFMVLFGLSFLPILYPIQGRRGGGASIIDETYYIR